MSMLPLSVMINNVHTHIYISKPSQERKVTTIGKIYDLNSSCHFNYFPFFFFHSIFHSLEIFSHLTKMFTKNWLHTPQRKRAMILVPHGDIGQTNEEYDNASRQ